MLQNVVESINGSAWAQSMEKPARKLGVNKNGIRNTAWTRTWCTCGPDLDMGKNRVWSVTWKAAAFTPWIVHLHVSVCWWQSMSPSLQDGAPEGVMPQMVQYNPTEYLWKHPELWNGPFCSPGHEFSESKSIFYRHLFHGRQKIFERRARVFTDEHRIRQDSIIVIKVRYWRK